MKRRFELFYLVLMTAFTVVYLVWRIGWTIPKGHGWLSLLLAFILLGADIVGIFEMLVHFYTSAGREAHKPVLPAYEKGQLPDVDVLVPTKGEQVELLKRTLTACLAMEYDDPRKVHIWLCDDAASPEMKELADSLGVGYFERKNGADAKAGNLNAALRQTKSPLVAVFDADMCPEPKFLLKTAPYFLGGMGKKGNRSLYKNMGYVQTPQCFRDLDLFQRAFGLGRKIPNEQDFFYRNLEPSRNKISAVVFGGSNTVLSRRALESIGGFITGTVTEDFATGIEIQKKGYISIALSETLAYGLCAEDLPGLIKQRSRWARGCIQSGRITRLLTSGGLSIRQRLSYLTSVTYWYAPVKRLIYLLAPLMFPVFGITVMNCDFRQMLIFWLPMYLMALTGIRLFSDNIRTARWSEIYELCLFPFLLLPVLAETAGIKKREFAVTGKGGKAGWNLLYPVPFIILIALSCVGIHNLWIRIAQEQTSIYYLLLFWLIFNLYELLYAFVFTLSCAKLPPQRVCPEEAVRLPVSDILRSGLLSILFSVITGKLSKEQR